MHRSYVSAQNQVLNRVLDGFEGKLTNAKWAALGKCTADTALRDITDLQARGVLRRLKGGGRSTGTIYVSNKAVATVEWAQAAIKNKANILNNLIRNFN